MVDIAIDKDGKFIRKQQGLALTGSVTEYSAQKLQITMKRWLGEYYLNIFQGMPYIQMAEKSISNSTRASIFKRAAFTIPTVTDVTRMEVSISAGRRFHAQITCLLTNGQTVEVSV